MNRNSTIAFIFCAILVITGVILFVAGRDMKVLKDAFSGNVTTTTLEYQGDVLRNDTDSIGFQRAVTDEELAELVSRYSFDETFYPYFGMLTAEQKKAYYLVYDCALNAGKSILLGDVVDLDKQDAMTVVSAVYNDHPELFWMESGVTYSYHSHNDSVSSLILKYNNLVYDLDNAREAFESQADSILNEAETKGDALHKEAFIHDRICELCTYDVNATNHQSAYSCLIEGRSVCSGYARSFQYLMQRMGVPAYYVIGTDAKNMSHAWVIVRFGSDFYNVDVTWDDDMSDQLNMDVHAFFNVSDEAMSSTHVRTENSVNLPACRDDSLSYDKVIGDTVTIDQLSFR
ncbi:MAG: hypothetical protein IKE53_06470 [Clostridiales bacterium]|nr:hypothetical protein [Clostridiales bacterium]